MTSESADIKIFENTIQQLHQDFLDHPFHYGNENPIMPELYRRLRAKLSPETAPVQYLQDHSYMDDWRNREMFNRLDKEGHQIPRVRPEVRFYDKGIWGGAKTDFDLAVFPAESDITMQGKKEGIGNFIDLNRSEVSVLCEIKHSMNRSGRFRSGGETDIEALAEFPGKVGRRYFLFMDWWPRDSYGNLTLEKDIRRLSDRIGELDHRVDVVYLPRDRELEFIRNIGSY